MQRPLFDTAANLPTRAGVYLFKDARGAVLYVGKAKNLRARVRQYLAGADERFMVPFLVAAAHDVDVVVTSSEKEALILENTLIKEHLPRYNTQLRDDKNFIHLRIDPKKPFPRYTISRSIRDDGARYFGPYASASRARHTLEFVQRTFPLRSCTDAVMKSRVRPCLLHQLKRCVAPCVGKADPGEYRVLMESSMGLLSGKGRAAVDRLRERMEEAAEDLRFEEAARFRDLLRDVEASLERQRVVDSKLEDRDVWGLHREGSRGAFAVLPVRDGVVLEPVSTVDGGWFGDDAEVLSSLVNNHYREGSLLPPEIVLPLLPEGHEALAEVLSERRGKKVTLLAPQRGDKVRLVELAAENAKVRYQQSSDQEARDAHALAELQRALGLSAPPRRIECFDNSNLLGEHPVAAMSVLIDGRPARGEYRRYRVKTVVGADDYATMDEILDRRLRRGIAEKNLPDLLVVDGGKGQLAVAERVRKRLGLKDLRIIGIAKPRTEHRRGEKDATDKLVIPGEEEPLRLPSHHPGLRLVQRVRDEVHLHALRYHRQVRGRTALVSLLDAIPGVGAARRNALLKALGSAEAVANAEPDALAAVPGIGPSLAHAIFEAFHPEEAGEADGDGEVDGDDGAATP